MALTRKGDAHNARVRLSADAGAIEANDAFKTRVLKWALTIRAQIPSSNLIDRLSQAFHPPEPLSTALQTQTAALDHPWANAPVTSGDRFQECHTNGTMLSEGDVFKPLHPSIRAGDTDEWPEFTLNHVRVLSQATHEPVSLLAAHGGFLVRVEGYLEKVEPANAGLLVKSTPDYHKKSFAIPNVATYSFAVFDDGTFGFWAAGKSGWFELASPSTSYHHTFEAMKEATGMFYYLADKFRKSGNKFVDATQRRVTEHVRYHFDQYPASKYCRKTDIVDVKEAFYHHREFLIKSMLEGHESLDWETSPILRHLKKKFPEDFSVIKQIVRVARTGVIPDRASALVETQRSQSRSERTSKKDLAREVKEKLTLAEVDDEEGISADDEEREKEEGRRIGSGNPRKRKRESILRPKSNKAAKKYASRQQGSRAREEEGSDDDVELDDAPIVSAAHGIDTKILPPTLPNRPEAVKASVKIPKETIWADSSNNPLPSYYEPRGPGDTWTCPYDGCLYQVWDARDTFSIDMIKDHFVDIHASNAESLVNQESRPWASVDHLLERIKGIAGLQTHVVSHGMDMTASVTKRF